MNQSIDLNATAAAYRHRGNCYAAANELENAEKDYLTTLTMDPEYELFTIILPLPVIV